MENLTKALEQFYDGRTLHVPGVNLLPDPSLDVPGSWSPTSTGNGVATVANGDGTISRPASGDTADISPNPSLVPVVGERYQIDAEVTHQSGTIRVVLGGVNSDIVTSGVHRFIVQATTTQAFRVTPVSPFPSSGIVHYISVRKATEGMGALLIQLRDYDGDKPQFSIPMANAASGTAYDTLLTNRAAIIAAIQGVTNGNIALNAIVAESLEPNDNNAASPAVQAHLSWIVPYYDQSTGDGPYQLRIRTADLVTAGLLLPNSDQADMAAAEWVALVTALENGMINPRTGNGVTIGNIYLEE